MRRVLVTGSAGHLGEAMVRSLRDEGLSVIGVDVLASETTDRVGSIAEAGFVANAMEGVDAVVHAATLHKPHVATHSRQAFVDTNVTGTLVLLEAAVKAGASRFVFTSTTSAFGRALSPPVGAPAAWIDEDVVPIPKNIYGATKTAAEDLCALAHRDHGLPIVVLRTSRFFPEIDDDPDKRREFADPDNLKAIEFLYRRVELGDALAAHRLALDKAPELGFSKLIVSATTPFRREDAEALGRDANALIRERFPGVDAVFGGRGWRLPDRLDRVYDNARARAELSWKPRFDFAHVLARLSSGHDVLGSVAARVGSKGYHRSADV